MTLAGVPYSNIEELSEMVAYLREGFRMEQPESCPYEM